MKKKVIGLIVLVILVVLVAMEYGPSLMGSSEESIEKSSVSIVTQIIQEQFGAGSSCLAVNIDEKVSENYYTATAYLNNGNELKVTIEVNGDQIGVRIPEQQ